MSHLNRSQQGFGLFVTELQAIGLKGLKPRVALARAAPVGLLPAEGRALALTQASSHFPFTTSWQICCDYIFHLLVKPSDLGEAARDFQDTDCRQHRQNSNPSLPGYPLHRLVRGFG